MLAGKRWGCERERLGGGLLLVGVAMVDAFGWMKKKNKKWTFVALAAAACWVVGSLQADCARLASPSPLSFPVLGCGGGRRE